MKSLNRQKVKIHYSLYQGEQEVVDDKGFFTGEKEIVYTEPEEMMVTIGVPYGNDSLNPFGTLTDYDRQIVVEDINCPIDEHSRLWIESSVDDMPDCRVVRVSKSLNHILYAIKYENIG